MAVKGEKFGGGRGGERVGWGKKQVNNGRIAQKFLSYFLPSVSTFLEERV